MSIRSIRALHEKLLTAVEATIFSKEEKENPSDKDDEILQALQEYQSTLEDALSDLDSAYGH